MKLLKFLKPFMQNQQIQKFFQSRKKYLTELLAKLVAVDTTNPPGNEYKAAKIVEAEFKKLKIPYKKYEAKKGRTNLVGEIGKGKQLLVIASHLDIVPAGKGWKTDPFKPVVKQDKMYGRGVLDNKGPLAATLVLADFLKQHEKELPGKILIAAVADEECGSALGMEYLVSKKILKAKYAIIPDIGGNLKAISIAEKGILNVVARAIGKQGHGAYPEGGLNAIDLLSQFLVKLRKIRWHYKKHKLLSAPTCSAGMIKGGDAPNVIPGETEAVLNIRYLPSQNKKTILTDLEKVARKTARKFKKSPFKFDLQFDIALDSAPLEVDKKTPLIKLIQSSAKTFKIKPKIIGQNGTTVCKELNQHGIVAVGFAPGEESVFHQANEYIDLQELVDFSAVLAKICLELKE
ncbi:hypothetical protein AUJ78_00110 [Candidatus Peregrinibacteria bacterium CG1_02_41_10]|nr:MAG: hypothetical protein AUJ78_00110 [Candidatus Peregrinibacteria bacterium CG1_02_41_10]